MRGQGHAIWRRRRTARARMLVLVCVMLLLQMLLVLLLLQVRRSPLSLRCGAVGGIDKRLHQIALW
jgi:hypothetical protein